MEQRHERAVVEFYRAVTGAEVELVVEIPVAVLRVLALYEYEELLRPVVYLELERGKSRKSIAVKWGIGEGYVRGVGEKYGVLPKRRNVERNNPVLGL